MKYTYCLICKTTSNLTRHHVIPVSITKHLNYQYKWEDIVCLCENCHKMYHRNEHQRMHNIVKQLGKDVKQLIKEKQVNDIEYEKIRRKITALTKVGLPEEVRTNYIKEIKEVFSDFTLDRLDYFVSICIANRTTFAVTEYLATKEDISKIEELCRKDFNRYVAKRIK